MAIAAPASLVPAPIPRAFVDLDDRVVAGQAGVVVVRAAADLHAGLVAHVARRLRTSGWGPAIAVSRPGAPIFREIATQLGVGALPNDVVAVAEVVAQACAARRFAVVASMPREGTWDHAVASELARAPRSLFVFITAGEQPAWDAIPYEVSSTLSAADKLRWLSAMAEEAQGTLPAADLPSLETWWSSARRLRSDAGAALASLAPSARRVLAALVLAGRSLPTAAVSAALEDATFGLSSLAAEGLVVDRNGLVTVDGAIDTSSLERAAAPEDFRAAAKALLASGAGPAFEPDPWAFARAAELLVTAGETDEADAAIARAWRTSDPQAGAELHARWFTALANVAGSAGLALRLRAAERALTSGAALEAQRWCESAAALDAEDATAALLMGRALMQLGDLVASGVSLERASRLAKDAELSARVSGELAELAFLRGALAAATELAERTIAGAVTTTTRLAGRNTLGKVLLAETKWDLADAHFAADALEAASSGEVTAELRARLNRAIALLSKGLLDDARGMLERILEDATRLGEDRAAAHAHSNLGVIAYRQHDYANALVHWEATTRFPQALRGRMPTAITVANLAELRLRLGLVDHAEHALVFGRRLLTAGAAPARVAHYRRVGAQIALARRATDAARREIDAALVDAEASGDRDVLQAVLVVGARIAMEDGDLARAAALVNRASELATHDRARAEVAILRALHLRALGKPALEAANEALSSARAAGDEDLLSEIHALLAVLHRDAGDRVAANAHCTRAISVRDQMAASLPADIRSAYLAKPEILALSRLQSALVAQAQDDGEEEAPRTVRAPFPAPSTSSVATAREIVGEDPQIRALLLAIRKVARSNSTVLIRGESGTGKELVAEALHAASDRATGPLVSVNCAALVETLLLSELFGHEKGAFTGAASRRRGRFEMAEGGTLFLDEIGDISPRTQVALLRVLQEKTFERVGGVTPIRANVRVICATHRDLKAMVERGEFREDLYYRLRGITLEVPALRQRMGDLPRIAEHLMSRIANERGERPKALSADALDLLGRHRWPGNIRELENVLRAVSLFAEGEVVTDVDLIDNVDDLRTLAQGPVSQAAPVSLRSILPPPPSLSLAEVPDDEESGGVLPDGEANATQVAYAQVRQGAVSLADMKRQIERDCIARALAETKGNITKAAALLGMKRPRLSQLVKQYGLSATSEGGQ